MKQRLAEIDIVKGIGIVLMVLGHCGFLFTSYIYLFHMTLFFIASGFCYSSKNSDSIKNAVNYGYRKIKGLYLPFIMAGTFCILMKNTFCRLHLLLTDASFINTFPGSSENMLRSISGFNSTIKELLKNLFFAGKTPLLGGSWFILALLVASLLFVCMEYLLKRIIKRNTIRHVAMSIITFLLLIIGYIISQRGITIEILGLSLDDKIPHVFDALFFFEVGYALKSIYPHIKKSLNCGNCLVSGGICFIALLIFNRYGKIEVLSNTITNPAYFFIVSILGFFGVYSSAILLKKTKLSVWLQYIGRNTMPILFFHFMAFKVVTYVQILFYRDPIEYLASYPVLHVNWFWVTMYALVGLSIPLIANEIYQKLKDKLITGCFDKYSKC